MASEMKYILLDLQAKCECVLYAKVYDGNQMVSNFDRNDLKWLL